MCDTSKAALWDLWSVRNDGEIYAKVVAVSLGAPRPRGDVVEYVGATDSDIGLSETVRMVESRERVDPRPYPYGSVERSVRSKIHPLSPVMSESELRYWAGRTVEEARRVVAWRVKSGKLPARAAHRVLTTAIVELLRVF